MGVTTYAVSWQDPGLAPDCGRLEVHPQRVLFEGSNGPRTVGFDELSSVRVSRSPEERRAGRPTLVLERRSGEAIRIGSLDGPGVVLELAERLNPLAGGPAPHGGRFLGVLTRRWVRGGRRDSVVHTACPA